MRHCHSPTCRRERDRVSQPLTSGCASVMPYPISPCMSESEHNSIISTRYCVRVRWCRPSSSSRFPRTRHGLDRYSFTVRNLHSVQAGDLQDEDLLYPSKASRTESNKPLLTNGLSTIEIPAAAARLRKFSLGSDVIRMTGTDTRRSRSWATNSSPFIVGM